MPRLTGFTGRQIATLLAMVGLLAVVLPIGARAAGQLVTITDSTSTNQANVDSNGSLQVANAKGVPLAVAGTVTVGNTPRLYQRTAVAHFVNRIANLTFPELPAGKTLVVQSVAVMVHTRDFDRALLQCEMHAAVGGFDFELPLRKTTDIFSNGADEWNVTQEVTAYASGSPGCRLFGNANTNALAELSIAGYLTP